MGRRTDGQTDRQVLASGMISKKKKKKSLSGCQVIFSIREKIILINIQVDMGNKTLTKK